jgi:hypothetical protein
MASIDTVFEILTHLMKAKYKSLSPEELSKIHMKRSAAKIIEDGYFASCSDYGLVFSTIARSKGIETKFKHFLDLNQFKTDRQHLSLHVFCECKIGDTTLFIDPQKGMVQNIIDETDYRHFLKRNGKDYILGYEGLDNFAAGIDSEENLLKRMTEVGNKNLS